MRKLLIALACAGALPAQASLTQEPPPPREDRPFEQMVAGPLVLRAVHRPCRMLTIGLTTITVCEVPQ